MAIFLSNRDGGLTDEQGHYRFQTNVWSGNVIGNGLQVTQSAPLGMSVLVGEGDARIPYSDYAYTPWVDGSETVTIATANPSNPRIDRVVMYVDRSEPRQQVNPNNPGISKLMAVAGTPGAVPVRPTNTTVQAAIGAGNPYIDLADVRVNAGVTQVTNANITDTKLIVSSPSLILSGKDYVASENGTTSTTWTDLATLGPIVTVDITSSGRALISFHAIQRTNNSGFSSDMSFVMSGANTLSSPSSEYLARSTSVGSRNSDIGATFLVTNLNPGRTTFTAKYQTNSGSAGSVFSNRKMSVLAI